MGLCPKQGVMPDDPRGESVHVAGDYNTASPIACWYLASRSPSNAMCC